MGMKADPSEGGDRGRTAEVPNCVSSPRSLVAHLSSFYLSFIHSYLPSINWSLPFQPSLIIFSVVRFKHIVSSPSDGCKNNPLYLLVENLYCTRRGGQQWLCYCHFSHISSEVSATDLGTVLYCTHCTVPWYRTTCTVQYYGSRARFHSTVPFVSFSSSEYTGTDLTSVFTIGICTRRILWMDQVFTENPKCEANNIPLITTASRC